MAGRAYIPRAERIIINREFASVEEYINEYVTNISRTGAFIRSRDPLPVGTRVNLKFSVIVDEIESIEGVGEVVRISTAPPGMGVVFRRLSEASTELNRAVVRACPQAREEVMSLARRIRSLVQANLLAWFDHHSGETTLDQFPEDELPTRSSRRSAPARTKRSMPQTAPPQAVRPPAPQMARLYEILEVSAGSDLETVKHSFRRLMRQYHPDLYTRDPERTKAATEKVQRLTLAYAELVRLLGSA